MNGLKRRLRSHFWFPEMNKKIESKVAGCKHCTMFSNKTTREPLQPHDISDEAWEDVSVDLFGPMPDRQHVIAVVDKSSRFPAAKIIPNTSNAIVTNALSEIYANYGEPSSHQTDNGPPFNSDGFAKFSADRGITHIKTYPYHPQGNPVENFMRPIGKCMKSAHYSRDDKTRALNEMLSSYRATPHPSTGLAPGNIMFRSGYKKDFPRTSAKDADIKVALNADRENRKVKGETINASNHRTQCNIVPNQLVFSRNMDRKKFDPIFGPELYKVVDVKGNGVSLIRLSDSKLVRRHLDDVKDATQVTEEEETWWVDDNVPCNDLPLENPLPPNNLAPIPPQPPAAAEGRPQRERRLPPRYRDDDWVMG